jgi:phosphatidate cytidylyltransferase
MKKRIITAIFMLAIFIPVIVLPEMFKIFQVIMALLSLVASNELIHMYEKKKKFPGFSKFIIMLCSLLIYLSASAEWQSLADDWILQSSEQDSYKLTVSYDLLTILNINIRFLPMLLLCAILIFSMLVVYRDFDGSDVGKALTIIIYSGVGFAGMTILRSIGLRFIVYMFLITSMTDVFAYFTGIAFGKHKMCPHISPHKTWEGSIGGTTIATVVASLYGYFYGAMFANPPFGPKDATTILNDAPFLSSAFVGKMNDLEKFFCIFALSLLTSIVSQLGDLVASKLKRTYEIKDYGDIFPGHGGVLDRFDSAIFSSMFLITVFTIIIGISSRFAF